MTTEKYDEIKRLGSENNELKAKVEELKEHINNLEEKLTQKGKKEEWHITRANMFERDVKIRDKTIAGMEKKIAECEVYESFYNSVFFGNRPVSITVGKSDSSKE